MVGKIINRARNLWIMIISLLVLFGILAAIWILSGRTQTEIPQKGAFVRGNMVSPIIWNHGRG